LNTSKGWTIKAIKETSAVLLTFHDPAVGLTLALLIAHQQIGVDFLAHTFQNHHAS